MIDLWFTVFGNQLSPLLDPPFLLNEFQFQRDVNVRVSQMSFDEAWPKLLNYALHGGGPHISLIGSIWTSTLQPMNVLRPFSGAEIYNLGGVKSFFPAGWENSLAGENGAWGIPFDLFTYLILYRKDLLTQAGIPEAGAFSSSQAVIDTLQRLKSHWLNSHWPSGHLQKAVRISSPLMLPVGTPFPGRPHIVASWIWGAGGDYINNDGTKTLLGEAEAMRGMADFFSLYRLMSPADYGFSAVEILNRFVNGQAAVIMVGPSSQKDILQASLPDMLENIGVAPLPGVPWIGGSNLVLWKEVCMHSEQERTALELATFLATARSQVKLAAAQYSIPARIDAMAQLTFAVEPYRAAVEQSLRLGRTYPPVKMWMRILNELRTVFDLIATDVIQYPEEDVLEILPRRMKPLVDWFNFWLS